MLILPSVAGVHSGKQSVTQRSSILNFRSFKLGWKLQFLFTCSPYAAFLLHVRHLAESFWSWTESLLKSHYKKDYGGKKREADKRYEESGSVH